MTNEHELLIFREIGRIGILIGSRRWGLANKESDWDYVLSVDEAENIFNRLKYYNIPIRELEGSSKNKNQTMYNEGNYKFELAGEIVNIISYKERDLHKIKNLNNYMDALKILPVGEDIALNRNTRIHFVEAFLKYTFDDITR